MGADILLAFGRCFILKISFALDTLRMANWSPTPASKINDFLGFDDIWGSRDAFLGRFEGSRGPGPEVLNKEKYIIHLYICFYFIF